MGKLLEELAKAQLEFKSIQKSGENPFLHNKYATLDDIVNATKEALANHGISVISYTEERGDKTFFITELQHYEDEEAEKRTEKDMTSLLKSSEKQTQIQIFGGIITYLRRYNLGMLLNLCTDEDIDGNDKGEKPKSESQQKPKANDKGESVPQEKPTSDEYIKRIEACKNVFEIKAWGEKHKEEIKSLPEAGLVRVREAFSLRQDILQKDHDLDKLSQLTKKNKGVIGSYLDANDLWGGDMLTKALKGNVDAITALDKELDDYVADKAVDLLGDGEKEHNPPA